jgi:hypothetical protein
MGGASIEGEGENLQDQISRRAYELYLDRGEQRDPIQNWLDAEREILGAHGRPMTEQDAGRVGGAEKLTSLQIRNE